MVEKQPVFPFRMTYEVPYADTDQMGVVYYANFLIYFERIRTRMLKDLGYPYSAMEKEDLSLPVIHAQVNYYRPAHFEDWLIFSAYPEILSPVRLKIHCRVHRDDVLLADGYTIHASYSRSKQRLQPLPAHLITLFSSSINASYHNHISCDTLQERSGSNDEKDG